MYSVGVRRSLSAGSASKYPIPPINTDTTVSRKNPFIIVFLTLTSDWAPKYWAMITPIPRAIPEHREKKRKFKELQAPTAPNARAPT